MEIKHVDLVALVKEEGEEQAAKDLKQGRENRRYRKNRNMKQAAILEAVKKDPRFKQIQADVESKVKKTA